MSRVFYIIGAGMGAPHTLTAEAAAALAAAERVFATERLQAVCRRATVCTFDKLADQAVAAGVRTAAVLVSGDVGFFSAAGRLRKRLAAHGEVRLVCGLSSMQYFCAKIGTSYSDACIRSLHGREGSILGAVSYHKKVFVLTGGAQTAPDICRTLTDVGLGDLRVHLGENLGGMDERIESSTAKELAEIVCGNLVVLLIEHPDAVDAHEPIRDTMLTRANVPMTKEEVRWVAVTKLGVQPDDTVWDVGAGTGAVTLELARKASNGMVYAVERAPEAIELLDENTCNLGGYNVEIVEGRAPRALEDLPEPDCVFVGGSGGTMRSILEIAKKKNPSVRVVITAIALETLHEAQKALEALDFVDIEVVQISTARGKAAGNYTMMMANNPVFILSGGGEE